MVAVTPLPGVALWVWVVLGAGAGAPAGSSPTDLSRIAAPARPMPETEHFPWYDARSGRFRPVLPWPDLDWNGFRTWIEAFFAPLVRWFRWLNLRRVPGIGRLGDLVAGGLALLFLVGLLIGLVWLLRRYRPIQGDAAVITVRTGAGMAERIEGLPTGARLIAADPRAEALRLHALGQEAGAVIHLFAYQLLTLEQAGQLRLVPGRTGRQLIRSVADATLRGCVEPTLRLFEAVYYGHLDPSPRAFEAAWALNLTLEQHLDARFNAGVGR